MSEREKKIIRRIAGHITKTLQTEIAIMALVGRKLTTPQRQLIYTEICRRARLVLLG